MLEIHLFGQLRVLLDGVDLKLGTPPKIVPLWALLLLHPGPISRDKLAGLLWPEDADSIARANLRRHLYHLQRALPAAPADRPWFLVQADAIGWNPAADFRLDVAEFARLSASEDSRSQAVQLYSGDLLENVYDELLIYQREQLRERYVILLSDLLRRARQDRAYEDALGFGQRLLAADPLREDALRQLLAVRYSSGDRAGALSEYERFARLLRAELGAEPMPETVAIYEAIRRNERLPDGAEGAGPATDNPRGAGRTLMPFTGRELELAKLEGYWRQAEAGRGATVFIGGEAGIGKSRLSDELALRAAQRGARVLRGAGTFAEATPYQTVTQALRESLPLVAALNIHPLWLSALLPLLPELQVRRPELQPLPALAPAQETARLFEALSQTFTALAQPRPLLLVLEDLHWAGATTVDFLGFLARRLGDQRLLVLCTYREEETGRDHPLRRMRRLLSAEHSGDYLALDRLTADAVQALVSHSLREAAPQEDLGQQMFTESAGNPLFLAELLRDWLEATANGAVRDRAAGLPGGVREVIASRVARLSNQANVVAAVAAVVGPAFGFEVVREVGGWSDSQVLEGIDELLDRQLVHEVGRGEWDYTFAHQLIQQAIYADVPAPVKRRRHRRVAQVLEGLYPERIDDMAGRLARHYDEGGATLEAVPHYHRAARRALALYADAEALAHLSRALALVTVPADRWDLLALREQIYGRQGARPEQQADLAELESIAATSADEERICECLGLRIALERSLGNRAAEAATIVNLRDRAATSGSVRRQAQALLADAAYQQLMSQYDAARDAAQQALALYQQLADDGGQVTALCTIAEVAVHRGELAEARGLLDRALAVSATLGAPAPIINSLRVATTATIVRQDFVLGLQLGQQMLDLCRTIGDRDGAATAHTRLAALLSRLFRIAEARENYTQAGAIYRAIGNRTGQAAVLVNSSALAGRLGHYEEAHSGFGQAAAIFRELGDLRGEAVCAVNGGQLAWYHGDFATARDSAAAALALGRRMNNPLIEANALANLGAAERDLGELAWALEHMEAGLALRRSLGEQPAELAQDLCDLAVALLLAGRRVDARTAAAEMLDLYGAQPEAMTHPQYILLAAACIERADGNMARAQQLLQQAHATYNAQSAAIPDPETRAAFIELPFNRELRSAFDQDVWPPYAEAAPLA